MIKSTQNPYIKYLVKLQNDSSFRRSEKIYIVEGLNIINEAIKTGANIRTIVVRNDFSRSDSLVLPSNVRVAEVNEECFNKFSQLKQPPGIAGIIEMPDIALKMDWINPALICDGINDPGNMGTIIRTADAMSWPGIICINNCVDVYSPKTLRASMGSHFRVSVMKWDIEELIAFKERTRMVLYGASSASGKAIEEWFDPNVPYGLVIGNEANGLSSQVEDLCDELVSVTMTGETESLNAAVAASILMNRMKP